MIAKLKRKEIYWIKNGKIFYHVIQCYNDTCEILFDEDGLIYAVSGDHKEKIGKNPSKVKKVEYINKTKNWIDLNHDRVNLTYLYNNIGKDIYFLIDDVLGSLRLIDIKCEDTHINNPPCKFMLGFQDYESKFIQYLDAFFLGAYFNDHRNRFYIDEADYNYHKLLNSV